jgi:acetyl-CoA carboxylase biotin carboxyl carrier protein
MTDSESNSGDIFDVDRIRRLVELMEQHDLREIDLRQAEQRIRLARGVEPAPPSYVAPVVTSGPAPAATHPASAADPDNIVTITSPMVGTFYSRPNPNTDAYVKIGDMIEPETTICIIEAMKVFNEIPAEVRGRVVAILVDDEEPVEFGKPLFKIDTGKGG